MAKFLSTSGTTFFLENLITKARKKVVLISPYLKLNQRVKEFIEDALHRGVSFEIVYGKKELKEPEKDWLLSCDNINLYYCNNLHAKCYLNDGYCIIGSMNLYEFSQVNNNEMSVLISKKDDTQAFTDAVKEAERLIRQSEKQEAEKPAEPAKAVPTPEPSSEPEKKFEKITTSKLAAKHKTSTKKLLAAFKAAELIFEDNGINKLTDKGKEAGAEFRKGPKGYYFIWPEDLNINKLVSS